MANPVSEKEKAVIRILQQDFPLVPEPYKAMADAAGMTEEEFLACAGSLKEKGALKRISVAVHHHKVGFTTNVMIVWDIPDEYVSRVGEQVSTNPAVTHCYCRNRQPGFPYNLYTMVHGMEERDYDEIIRSLQETIGKIVPGEVAFDGLRTKQELKKVGMRYFCEKPEEMIGE